MRRHRAELLAPSLLRGCGMNSFSRSIENTILKHGSRGMDRIRSALAEGYCIRAADIVLANRGRVVMGRGSLQPL